MSKKASRACLAGLSAVGRSHSILLHVVSEPAEHWIGFLSWFQGSIPRLWRPKQGLFRSSFRRCIMSSQPQSFGQALPKTSPCLGDWEIDSFSYREEQQRHLANGLCTQDGKNSWPYFVIYHRCIDASESQESNLDGRPRFGSYQCLD